ncbi:complement component C7 [Parambassis ranga]|uniref:Complement component C7 n=1 Tax=Parambassis ranga TaxID=210632 RepID=A0A6P7J117_9TELE|nr:complement component C7-like [Parambassis ranga]
MKKIAQLCATCVLPWLLFLFISKGLCVQRVHCQWGPFGSWSECDGCTKLQTRSRAMAVYAQFGGNPCMGARTETRPCETTKSCPLEEGCGDRFRCRSGKCISSSLVCNGDQDCEEDGLDENGCGDQKYVVCQQTVPPPNIEPIGLGYDVVTGKRRGSVINTKSFGGQCRPIYSGVHRVFYRLPLSITGFNFLVKVQNDFSSEMFSSKWHYAKDIVYRETVSGTTTGHRNYDYHLTQDITNEHSLMVLKNNIEVAQFQSNSPKYLPISERFWRALAKLPSVYDYSAYRKVLQDFGTHYLSEGNLGGSFEVFATVSKNYEVLKVSESTSINECEKVKRWFLFFPIYTENCINDGSSSSSTDRKGNVQPVTDIKANAEGGDTSKIAALNNIKPNDLEKNWQLYSDWAESVGSFPHVTEQKLRPLSELVKEVQCAGLKKLYLRRAIEQYLTETDTCRCQPCRNNGLVVMDRDECKCICKPNTSGLACEQGTEIEGQPGVIHGRWSCWSAWSPCSGGRRSRSRSCSNPAPQNGGQFCIGEPTETSSDCDDEELQYLKTMEPQCFDQTLPPIHKCETPPALINGYVLNPKDLYIVGSKAEYTCIFGFYLVGPSIIVCSADQTWSGRPGLCTPSRCTIESLADGVTASPLKGAYGIGESVTLSCTEGRELLGESTVTCDPSLHFSPDPAGMRCSQVRTSPPPTAPSVQCKVWEKPLRGKCVCKMPYECGSSLELCATISVGRQSYLSVCKMHALQCMGKNPVIAEDSACKWPQRNTAGCTGCHMWETCDDQTNTCRCRDSADCAGPGLNVCVRVGEDETAATQTMSECEAGLRRCKGDNVSVVSILPCTS